MNEFMLSVIIPTYNRSQLISDCLYSISKQLLPYSQFEVIVVDDCSNDDTWNLLNTLEFPFKYKFERNKKNSGRAKTRNRALELVSGDVILMLDDDIYCDQNLFINHLKLHKSSNKALIVAGSILNNKSIKNTIWNKYISNHHEWAYEEMLRNKENLSPNFFKTANVSVHKKIVDNIGGFNESFTNYGCEDTYFGYLAVEAGYEIIFESNAIGYHYHDENFDMLESKFYSLGVSSNELHKIKAKKNRSDYDGFFITNFNEVKKIRHLFYNIIKFIIFKPFCVYINKLLIKRLSGFTFTHKFITSFLLPIYKIQIMKIG